MFNAYGNAIRARLQMEFAASVLAHYDRIRAEKRAMRLQRLEKPDQPQHH